MSEQEKKKPERESPVIEDKAHDPWKPFLDADPESRRGWLRMEAGVAPADIEAWARERGYALKWVNTKDEGCTARAYRPDGGPPWMPVLRAKGDPHPFFGRPGVDGHSAGSLIEQGGELTLSYMPAALEQAMQDEIQRETDEISAGLGGKYEDDIRAIGAEPQGSLYEPARSRPGGR